MARLFKNLEQISAYKDRRFVGTQDEFEQALQTSTTVYVGNLSFYTTEEQLYELFSRCGEIKKIVMGLDKNSKTPCGFCFILYYTREDTEDAVKCVSGTVLDDRPIRVDFDWGFQDGRQWGRGRSGGQVRDEYRTDYDPGRGGYGKLVQRDMESRRQLVDYTQGAGVVGAGPNFGRNQYSGSYGRNSGRDRKRRRDEESMPADGVKSSTDRDTRDKNPRFREKGDSDEEDAAANAAANTAAAME